MTKVSIDIKDYGLEKLIEVLDKDNVVDVGIFNNSKLAEIGEKLEFGSANEYVPEIDVTVNIPPRSFLYAPIEENLENEIKGQINDKIILEDKISETIGREAQNIVEVTFHNEGYGKWEDNLPLWKAYKQEHGYDTRILHKTGTLSESIEYKVRK